MGLKGLTGFFYTSTHLHERFKMICSFLLCRKMVKRVLKHFIVASYWNPYHRPLRRTLVRSIRFASN